MASASDSLLMARLKQKYLHHSRNWDAVVREIKTGHTVCAILALWLWYERCGKLLSD